MKIKLLVMDVDGTLTDGSIYISGQGEPVKMFNAKDGLGITWHLPPAGIIPAVITGRKSASVERRCAELGIAHLFQNADSKLAVLESLLNSLSLSMAETAYIGDDLNDYAAMKACGYKACPADAVKEIREICDYISPCRAGHGAVRDIIEHIIQAQSGHE
jgi:3-deoxy-D-manno-octulosonate 8-phosphate phosphatase (KDO 8-P phosphatase)